ncbi:MULTISPECIES: hypothetical protein [Bacillaceae]|uniref:hypothetical protein n=1 Tax=Bacillaceae TaxID=186817 RepID=UPI0006F719FC|nr:MULTISPECIES: hypothetical protein [Bacillaceae]KQL34912.1 hypothetical protein AN959_11125 [Psychrobacillus sp. FJAT-21963]MDF2067368.1 hypothetical protein [Bacillus sp. Cr_A10]
MKSLFPRFLFIILIALLTIGCSSQNIEEVNVYKMDSFSKVGENSLTTYTDSSVMKDFKNAFNSANKEPGIVNMVDPDYKIEFGDKSYFLWISDEHGTIMNTNDTHTIYSLSESSAKKIVEILN